MSLHQFSFPTTITFGAGARKKAGGHLAAAGIKRPLVVTDQGIATLPLAAEFLRDLQAAGLSPALFSGVRGNPAAHQVGSGADPDALAATSLLSLVLATLAVGFVMGGLGLARAGRLVRFLPFPVIGILSEILEKVGGHDLPERLTS